MAKRETRPQAGMAAWKEAARIVGANSDGTLDSAKNLSAMTNDDSGVPAGLFMLVAQLVQTCGKSMLDPEAEAIGHMGLTGFIAGMLYERDRVDAS